MIRFPRVAQWACASAFVAGMLAIAQFPAQAQPKAPFNERNVEPAQSVFDKGDVWTLNFRFKDPRIITAEIPGRGKKIIWYMWYQVINNTGEPRYFIPDFELFTLDRNTRHTDEVLPAVEEVIRKIEDPTGRLNILNSVTISKEPIQPTKPNAVPRPVTGVAIWTDVYDRAADTNRFSIFVTGLSNGFTEDDNKVIRRKTLQLNFRRLTDAKNLDSDAIEWVDDPGRVDENPRWIYRATSMNFLKPMGAAPAAEPKADPAR
ncbi:hypothetical protein [Tuwongella immobilis]|uniref:Uncharacterized protein n=1 Tax=Tuwongella immobilis TaxID=692036 RepID=A0A6C2YJK4_9BACT|nr:hypothetical protein [Tuwongella immobilis]VIP01596.1 Uncharacterized protein OS=Singulisphaera acidiphila (strain ATCC BAA-1392 / DSM 18658 / VKM B-2454 / MOB10) GN=Sinac_6515 PE=4 SV=1 [Tuwongella immobilis]VTR98877.1 Uncharacterized protein OS=Singulisphaera acidiphila (strain ATCC BAA-1392 / DSM 18658 / VKM B-2454 / MOB10) GN=Sinac_6515 PE=4 SV=1 [Tuwongella immobilis]